MKKTLLILTFIFLGACAKEDGNTEQALVPVGTVTPQTIPQGAPQKYPYQYDHSGNNCTTGPQRYRTRERYCDGLRNESINNRCAVQARYQDFRQNCTDRRWQR